MVCLDSDFLIDFIHNNPTAVNKLAELKKQSKQINITSINSFELLVGISRANKEKLEQLRNLILNFQIYDFNFRASERAAEIFNFLKSKGEILELPDIMIASIVIENNETLITGNKKHFERIPGIKIDLI